MWHDTFRLKHAQQEVKKKQTELKKTEQGYKKDQAAYEAVQQSMKKIQVRFHVAVFKLQRKIVEFCPNPAIGESLKFH